MHTANDKKKIKNQTNGLTFFQQLLNKHPSSIYQT